MPMRFSVLASGSAGNACVLSADGFGVLIDAGLGPRLLSARLAAVGLSWNHIHAVVLSHTHSDHRKEQSLAHLVRQRLPLYCHAEHRQMLAGCSTAFRALHSARLIRDYVPLETWTLAPGLICKSFPLTHDSGATFGFRFEIGNRPATVAYAADLGCWTAELAEHLADADILALEFNHDVELEKSSGRGEELIARVLGDFGHLSNDQAADLLREVLRRSEGGRLQHLVQLHLSRECNRPSLAVAAAQRVLHEAGESAAIHTSEQDMPGPNLLLAEPRPETQPAAGSASAFLQPLLPGWEAG